MILHFNDDRDRLNISFDNCEYNCECYDGADWIQITPDEMQKLQDILDEYARGNYTPDRDLSERTADAERIRTGAEKRPTSFTYTPKPKETGKTKTFVYMDNRDQNETPKERTIIIADDSEKDEPKAQTARYTFTKETDDEPQTAHYTDLTEPEKPQSKFTRVIVDDQGDTEI